MKRVLYFVLMMTFCACVDNEMPDVIQNVRQDQPNIRSIEEAIKIAEESFCVFKYDSLKTRASSSVPIIDKDNVIVIRNNHTRSNSAIMRDTLLYIVNYSGNNGYAVISANKSTEELLAFAENGNYQDAMSSDTGFPYFMQKAAAYANSEHRPILVREPIDTVYSSVGPYISVAWGQDYPTGSLVPNGVAGCTNVAIAQILTYFRHPNNIVYTAAGGNENIQINWSAINKHKRTFNNSCVECLASDETHIQISKLVCQIGDWNHSIIFFNPNMTGVLPDSVHMSLDSLGYNYDDYRTYQLGDCKANVNSQKLMLMSGNIPGGYGHSWVADGHKSIKIRYLNHNYMPARIDEETTVYNHLNWGWNGLANGYYLDNVFDDSRVYQKDYPIFYSDNYYFVDVKYRLVYR